MYRVISASKDSYVTDKFINGTRVTQSNVGQAATLDLYKLQNETSVSGVASPIRELTRAVIQFDYKELQDLTSSFLDTSDSSFKCFLSLKDVYGGQTIPSNYRLNIIPLSKSFDEGRGFDVEAYRDKDAVNWITASFDSGTPITWSQPGIASSGSFGEDVDIVVSGNIGSGNQALGTFQRFNRGDENLYVDITHLVSASMNGILPNYGFRISFSDTEETDSKTRFVKRFGTRHTSNKDLRPKLIVKFNDHIIDKNGFAQFGSNEDLFIYNIQNGQYANFTSGSSVITGSNSLMLELAASRSVSFTTESFSDSHKMTITHLTRSMKHFSQSFSGSQFQLGNKLQTGIYSASVNLDPVVNDDLRTFLSGANQFDFKATWKSLDKNVVYGKDFIKFINPQGGFANVFEENLVSNITNLKDIYLNNSVARLRFFVVDNNTEQTAFKYPVNLVPKIFKDVRYRVVDAFDRTVIIPFDESTRLSTDKEGMYFDVFMKDLDVNRVYEIEFQIKRDSQKDLFITNKGYRFKIVDRDR